MMVKRKFRRFEPFEDNEDAQMQYLSTKPDLLAEQDTQPLAVLYISTPAVSHKVVDNMSMAVRSMIAAGLTRLQDPQPEGLFTRGLQAVKPGTNILGLLPILTLTSTLGVLIASFAYYFSAYGSLAFEIFFLPGLLLIFVPVVVRLMSPAPSRFERICLLCVVGLCFYLVQLMISPLHFSGFDDFLAWRTADDIARSGHLFTENSMLPVGPYYPGLEIMANTLSTISGLNTFYAGVVVISAARLLMTLSLFMLYEQITESSRIAGIATIIYMTNQHFLLFDASFSYETLALPLAICMLYILVRYQTMNKDYRWIMPAAYITLLAVSVTHHMTDYVFDGLLILWAVVSLFQASSRNMRRSLATIALFGVFVSLAYAFLYKGNPVWGYLSEYFKGAFNELGRIFIGTNTARPLFVGPAGQCGTHMGSTIDDGICSACRIWPPIRTAQPLATAPSQCSDSHVRYLLARLPLYSGISIHTFWFRDYRPLCRFSLFTHCLRVGHLHYTFLADAKAKSESNLTDHLCTISGVPGGSSCREWSSLVKPTGPLYGCS